jgi:hypothetical protein
MRIVQPERVAHSYTQHLAAPVETVFPLLCPVREVEWAIGWDPSVVMTTSGVAELDCVFVTSAGPDEAVWVVSAYQPPSHVEFFKFTAGHSVARISIDLRPEGAQASAAEVTYAYTALGPRGAGFLREFTPANYLQFMQAWEAELNHYLRTGAKLAAAKPAV